MPIEKDQSESEQERLKNDDVDPIDDYSDQPPPNDEDSDNESGKA
jgi:hypothetical protein